MYKLKKEFLSNENGKIVESYETDVFGNIISGSDSVRNSLFFTRKNYDKETGFYFFNARYYNPELARFISRDPIGIADDIHLYAYVKNNPLKFTDPSGMEKKAVISPLNPEDYIDYSKLDNKEKFNYMIKYIQSETYKEVLKKGNKNGIDALWDYSMIISENSIEDSFINIYNIVRTSPRLNYGEDKGNYIKNRLPYLPNGLDGEYDKNSYGNTDKLQHFFTSAAISYHTTIDYNGIDIGGGIVEISGFAFELGEEILFRIKNLFGGNRVGFDTNDLKANSMGANFGKELRRNGNIKPPSKFIK